jgi:hypothetical protein
MEHGGCNTAWTWLRGLAIDLTRFHGFILLLYYLPPSLVSSLCRLYHTFETDNFVLNDALLVLSATYSYPKQLRITWRFDHHAIGKKSYFVYWGILLYFLFVYQNYKGKVQTKHRVL